MCDIPGFSSLPCPALVSRTSTATGWGDLEDRSESTTPPFRAVVTSSGNVVVAHRRHIFALETLQSGRGWLAENAFGAIDPVTSADLASVGQSFAYAVSTWFTSIFPGGPRGLMQATVVDEFGGRSTTSVAPGARRLVASSRGYAMLRDANPGLWLEVHDGTSWTRSVIVDVQGADDDETLALAANDRQFAALWSQGGQLLASIYDDPIIRWNGTLATDVRLWGAPVVESLDAAFFAAFVSRGHVFVVRFDVDGVGTTERIDASEREARDPRIVRRGGGLDLAWTEVGETGDSIQRARYGADGWTRTAPLTTGGDLTELQLVDDNGKLSAIWRDDDAIVVVRGLD